jgi:hypothetical protein
MFHLLSSRVVGARFGRMAMSAVMATVITGGFVLFAGRSNGQGLNTRAAVCRHGEDESPANRTQRLQALALASAINRAEGQQAQQTRRYAPLPTLGALPPVPQDFTLKLYADAEGYVAVLKDGRDPCRYAIFTEQSGHIYETSSPAQIAD